MLHEVLLWKELKSNKLNGLGLVVIRLQVRDVFQNMVGVISFLRDHPALSGTPPVEGNKSYKNFAECPAQVGNKDDCTVSNSPPLEGWQAKPDGVVR